MTAAVSTRISRADVVAAYELLLGRAPESESVIAFQQARGSLIELTWAIAYSPECLARHRATHFYYFNSSIDALAIIRAHDNPQRQRKEGHVVNYLGVAMNTRFVPSIESLAGTVENVPIPCNWHADIAEWAAAMRAVDLARGSFSVVELGCGWGCWMNNTGTAAKRRGLAVHAIGVEGDSGHLDFAREALATNGFAPGEYTLHLGVAAARPGVALFPRQDRPGTSWGSEPIFNATDDEVKRAVEAGGFDQVAIVPLQEIVGAHSRIDLLHMDIQGGEADLVHDCLALLSESVAYLVIGTHSRQIEGRLFADLIGAGWILEIEKPAIIALADSGPVTTMDGVQGWRNPRLFGARP